MTPAGNPSTESAIGRGAAIIIPAQEVNPLVRRCVDQCRKTCPGAEIIVLIDDGEGANTLGTDVRTFVTGVVTIASKRNRGAAETDRKYLAFIDSDAFPAPDWLDNALRLLEDDPSMWICGGPNVSPPDETGGRRLVGLAQRSALVTGHLNFRKQVAPARFCDDLPSCNMVMARERYLSLGGMNEDLYIYEDKDLCRRVIEAGGRIFYSPDVLVYHQDRTLKRYVLQRLVWGAHIWSTAGGARRVSDLIIFLPTLAVGFFLSGLALPWLPAWGWIYGPVAASYGLVIAAESVRRAPRLADVPGLALALVIGNLGPGVGSLLGPLGLLPRRHRLYRNYE